MRQLIEASEELVEQSHQFLSAALRGEHSEADNVRKENAHVLVLLYVDAMELPSHRRQNVVLHLHCHMLWQHRQQQTLQLLVLILYLQTGRNAVACIEERTSLSTLHHNVHNQTGHIHADEDDNVGNQLIVLQVLQRIREYLIDRQADVHRGQGNAKCHSLPDLQRHHGICQKDHKHYLPYALGHDLLGVHGKDTAQCGHRYNAYAGREQQYAIAQCGQMVILDDRTLQQHQHNGEQHAHD